MNQPHDKEEKPTDYFSKKVLGAELNYYVTEKEGLTIYEAIKFSSAYLYMHQFTDHAPSPLRFTFVNKLIVPCIAR